MGGIAVLENRVPLGAYCETARNVLKTFLFFGKTLLVIEAGRVKQAQACEVPTPAELFRGCCEQQYRWNNGRECCHYVIGIAGEMMSFIDHHHVKACSDRSIADVLSRGIVDQCVGGKQYQLLGQKRVAIRG